MRINYHKLVISFLFLALIYTRFVNLPWGLPYPMHPDERNMAVAISQLSCPQFLGPDCLNPHFLAYGQLPLYMAYFGVIFFHLIFSLLDKPILYSEAVIALRVISAVSSVFTVWFMIKICTLLAPLVSRSVHRFLIYCIATIFIFSPGLIQFAHFGTTESLLMFFYTLLIYISLQFMTKSYSYYKYIFLTALILGLAIGTKASSLIFSVIPFFTLIFHVINSDYPRKLLHLCFAMVKILALSLILSILFSPYNFIQFSDFLSSMSYESDIATGRYVAFYIRQFVGTMPVLFQFVYIFPYSIGWGVIVLFILGFLFLPFNREINLLRVAFLSYFLPTAFLFSKWTRFMSPIFPIILLIATLFLFKVYDRLKMYLAHWLLWGLFLIITIVLSLRGIAYLSIYTTPDVRFTTSDWVFNHIPSNSYIFSETANVVDIPISAPYYAEDRYAHKTYKYISFNLYDLEANSTLQDDLKNDITKADYIFIPSRRIFMNHTCYTESLIIAKKARNIVNDCVLKSENYFAINDYYNRLFSGELGFQKVAEFSSYPSISIFGKKLIKYRDEGAEESWTVFDHPVIRIFKRVQSH